MKILGHFAQWYIIFTLSFFCLATHSLASSKDVQAWTALAVSGPINHSRLLFWFDAHARFGDDVSELETSIIRPGLGWQATDNTSWWLGYARVTGHSADPNIVEDRVWQQALYYIGKFSHGQLTGRSRLEQRFRDEDNDIGVRLRQFLRWSRPVNETPWSYVISNEMFINLNDADWGQSDGFNQNRLFLGLNYKLNEIYRVEFGYVNNYIRHNGAENQLNNIFSSNLSITW